MNQHRHFFLSWSIFAHSHHSAVQYVDGPCGSGKTYACAQYFSKLFASPSATLLGTLKAAYVAPTIRLLNEFRETLHAAGITDVETITSDDGARNSKVAARVIGHLQTDHDDGHVLLITHAALLNLPYFPKKSEYYRVIDEVPQFDEYDEIVIAETSSLLNGLFDIQRYNHKLSRVTLKSKGLTRKLVEGNDGLLRPLIPWCKKLLNDNHDLFTNTASWPSL